MPSTAIKAFTEIATACLLPFHPNVAATTGQKRGVLEIHSTHDHVTDSNDAELKMPVVLALDGHAHSNAVERTQWLQHCRGMPLNAVLIFLKRPSIPPIAN
jgi:hypothetical protein